jgi:hypothetical protein
VNGVKMTLADAADLAPVGYNTFLYRLKRGWSLDDAISLPRQKGIRP